MAILNCKWCIYIGVLVFFIACVLGYASHGSVDAVVKKAIIAGSSLGVVFYFSMRVLISMLPDTIHKVGDSDKSSVDDSQGQKVDS